MGHIMDVVINDSSFKAQEFAAWWNAEFSYVDIGKHFEDLLMLAEVSKNIGDYGTVAYAFKQAIEMFEIEKRIGAVGTLVRKIDIGLAANFLSFPGNWPKDKIIMELCLAQVVSNEMSMGDPRVSYKFAHRALECFHLLHMSKDEKDLEKESSLQFLVARMIYGYALYLAGGKKIASSPPIAAIPPDPKLNQPTIKELLEECVVLLDSAKDNAPDDDLNPSGLDAVQFQVILLIIVACDCISRAKK
jgi:hypothetical protein